MENGDARDVFDAMKSAIALIKGAKDLLPDSPAAARRRGDSMKRYRRLALGVGLGTALLRATVPGFAQASRPLPAIGVLRPQNTNSSDTQYQAFLRGLADRGLVEGKTIQIHYRSGEFERLPELAQDLVRLNVAVIFAPTPQAAQAARKASAVVPIVVSVIGDPVATGLAASLAHPGGNVTGLTALGSNLSGKRLELLKEIVPRLARVAVFWNPAVPDKQIEWREMTEPARQLKIELLSLEVRSALDFEPAFENALRLRAEAVIGLGEPLVYANRARIIEFANRARLPSIFNWREAAQGGALVAYGPDIVDLYRRAGAYVDKILKGAKPGDLPIEQPVRFDFAVNLQTARALGRAVPQSVLLRADEVIQ